MSQIVAESPAKINLGLNVVRKRIDGYHDLETVFIPILLKDYITFQKSNELKFNSNSELLNDSTDNLIINAIRLLEAKLSIRMPLDITLEKNIPIGGGLGGGSSNAATTLKSVNKIMNLGLTNTELSDLALTLGSDVPYFLNAMSAYAESRGEILSPLNLEVPYPILLINPGIKIKTKWAFDKIVPSSPKKNLKDIIDNGLPDFDMLNKLVTNDFEKVVFKEYPEIEKIKIELYKLGAQFALMTGTGSTVYGIFSNLQKAEWAEENFKQEYFTYLNNPFVKGSIT